MTTYTPFDPTASVPIEFLTTLDFQTVNCNTPWSFFGKRRYLAVQTPGSALIVHRALVSSPIGYSIKALEWNNGRAHVTTMRPHTYLFMATANLTISGCLPDILNGLFSCYITGPDTLEYQLPTPVDNVTQFGKVDYNINLVEKYFASSTLVFREATGNIEVTP